MTERATTAEARGEDHVPSCADLPAGAYPHLEELFARTAVVMEANYQRPLFFEYGPAIERSKGQCCVDHAHVHAFPVEVDIHLELRDRFPFRTIGQLSELRQVRSRPGGYLFLDQAGTRYVYEADAVPSQLIRKIIATHLGVPDRWHWRTYLGIAELIRTVDRLKAAAW